MELLERETDLEGLESAFKDAQLNQGSVVLVGGEAGIGKTQLIRAFAAAHENDARILWGGCDDLSTPRTLGPFRDIALHVGGDLKTEIGLGGSRGAVFDAAFEAIDTGVRPTIVLIEDVHWADGATLDVIKFIGRRIDRTSAMLVLTYREEETPADRSLTVVAGDIPASSVRRLHLAPLSRAAVDELAVEFGGSKDQLYSATQGNPFLVTEMLRAATGDIPPTVRDAVRARSVRLSPAGLAVAELTSVIPRQAELWLVTVLPEFTPEALEECRERGLVDHDAEAVWYRHELVRGAMEETLSPQRRSELNQLVLDTLVSHDADVARIVHHGQLAGDGAALAHFAPTAGRQASAAAAHREALAHFRLAVAHLGELGAEDRALLMTDYAIECYRTNEVVESLDAAEQALEMWRDLGNTQREGDLLRWRSRLLWWLGRGQEAEASGAGAIEVLETIPHTRALAMAYSNLAQLCMLAQRSKPAEVWASKAIDVARELGDHATLAHALNNLGSARVRVGDLTGFGLLGESLEISLREQLDDHAGRAYANIIWTELDYRRYDDAERHLEEGLEFTWKREQEGSHYYLMAEQAMLKLETGEWSRANDLAQWVLSRPEEPGITQMPALATLARLRVRTGHPSADETLEEAWMLAQPTGELQRVAPVALARAEQAWLAGDDQGVGRAIGDMYAQATATGQPWIVDELAFWLWRSGHDAAPLAGSTTPYTQHMAGNPLAAARAWRQIGVPYEEALALADSGNPEHELKALEILDGLGAIPAASRLRRKLRQDGISGVPRGPRPATRAHPAGLTPRQVDVLELLVEGLTNAQIADRLFISPKTVDHHVSALLAKLDASGREQAAELAREQRLV